MYQALYRKWRPKTFDEVVGQEHITETLKRQVVSGRLSHAYLFVGTEAQAKRRAPRSSPERSTAASRKTATRAISAPTVLGSKTAAYSTFWSWTPRQTTAWTTSALREKPYSLRQTSKNAFTLSMRCICSPPRLSMHC